MSLNYYTVFLNVSTTFQPSGDAAGVLYAGAEANPQTGAGAILGGDTSRGGYAGSQAFSGGRTVASTKNHIFPGAFSNQVDAVTSGPSDFKPAGNSAEYDGIQKVRPPKKYLIKPSVSICTDMPIAKAKHTVK